MWSHVHHMYTPLLTLPQFVHGHFAACVRWLHITTNVCYHTQQLVIMDLKGRLCKRIKTYYQWNKIVNINFIITSCYKVPFFVAPFTTITGSGVGLDVTGRPGGNAAISPVIKDILWPRDPNVNPTH